MKTLENLTKEEIFNTNLPMISFIENKYCISVGYVLIDNGDTLVVRHPQKWKPQEINKKQLVTREQSFKYFSPNVIIENTVFEVLGIKEFKI